MSRRFLLLPLLFLLFLLPALAGCDKESPVQQAPVLTGTFRGKVILHDYMTDAAVPGGGATVSLDGTRFSAVTDSNQRWTITDLPTGTYDITVSKEGYGDMKVFGYQFVGGGTVYYDGYMPYQDPSSLSRANYIPLYRQVDRTFSAMRVETVDTVLYSLPRQRFIHVMGVMTGDDTSTGSSAPRIIAALGNEESPTLETPESLQFYGSGDRVNDRFDVWILPSSLRSTHGFAPGSTLYLRVYAIAIQGGYFDPATDRRIYTGYAESEVVSFVLP